MQEESPLTDQQQQFLVDNTFGMLTTIRPDGMPSTNPVSYLFKDGRVLVSTIKSRYKYKCILKNNRVAFCVQSTANPMEYIEIRGLASVQDDPDSSLLREQFLLAQMGEPPADLDEPGEERVIISVEPQRVSAPQLYGGRFDR